MTQPQTHETLSRAETVSPGSDRSFGFVMAGAFTVLAALSYWRGGVGAYGYLVHAIAEGDTLQKVIGGAQNGSLKLRCSVPADALAKGGLTIYGAECGRFPLCPTVIIEW